MNARFCATSLAVFLLCVPAYADNLLVNGDFESSPPGPGVAAGWNPHQMPPSPPANYEVTPIVVYSGVQSQQWASSLPFEGGIWQHVTGLAAGVTCEASVYFCNPVSPGSSVFRIGIEPNGGPPEAPTVVWSAPMTAGPSWQQLTVQAAVNADAASVVLKSVSTMPGGSVFVDNAQLVPTFRMIANVPDFCQLAADNTNNNYCGPVAAVNITEYWDVVKGNASAAGVNAGLGKAASAHIAYWMDTNDAGCPYRLNGCAIPQFPSANGTYVGDIAPGVAQFARWDAANSFGCTPPPNLPAGKNGYPWTVQSLTNNGNNLQGLWNQLANEIIAGRPLLVTWSYWKLDATNHVRDAVNNVDYYEWGAPAGGSGDPDHGEEWNEPYDPTAGIMQIGHIVTAVGFRTNYDPDGVGPLPKDNWVICHDTWCDTPTNVALPMYRNLAQQTTAWSANTTIRLQAPVGGGLTEVLGAKSPKDHWGGLNKSNVMIQLKLTETSGNQPTQVNAVKLTAVGTGDDKNDISSVDLWDDANADGKLDGGDTFLASSFTGYPVDNGTMTIPIVGPIYNIAAGTTRHMLIVYSMGGAGSHGSTYKFTTPTLYVTGANAYLPIAPNVGLFLTSSKKLSTISLVPRPCPRIGWWKMHPDGTFGVIQDCSPAVTVATGILPQKVYLQEPDRSAGIQMYFGDEPVPTLAPGDVLEFEAYIDTVDGERVLVQPAILGATPGLPPWPLALGNREVGGGDWAYNPATGAGQKGITGAVGLNNIGLLVRVFGRVVSAYPEGKRFWLDDGSGLLSWLRVTLPDTWTAPFPEPPQYVAVTGICCCEPGEGAGELARLIRVRTVDDIQPVAP